MGAAGSVEAGEMPAASATCNAVEETAGVIEETSTVAKSVVESMGSTSEVLVGAVTNSGIVDAGEAAAQQVIELAPSEEVRNQVSDLLRKVHGIVTIEQVQSAVAVLRESSSALATVSETAFLAAVGSALQQASEMAPEVVHIVGETLSFLGSHLGPLMAAAGFLGAIVYTFELSKDQDKNVNTVMVWSASVKDWLLLVAGRVERSQAESTGILFEALKDGIEQLFTLIQKRGKRWRLGKMLGSSSFQRAFERAKTSVLELKNALRDFLDQEALDLQEKQLGTISEATLELSAKLDTMDEQLAEIRSILQEQQAQKQKAGNIDLSMDEETQIYTSIATAAGVSTASNSVKFKDFVIAFEYFFLAGQDMTFQTKRGLKYAIDKDGSGHVTSLTFAKFFRCWKESGLSMQEHLARLADSAPPTFYATAVSVAAPVATEAAKTAVATLDSAAKKAEQIVGCTKAASAIGDKISNSTLFGSKKSKIIPTVVKE